MKMKSVSNMKMKIKADDLKFQITIRKINKKLK